VDKKVTMAELPGSEEKKFALIAFNDEVIISKF
jgi:hypothetical protein